MLDPVVFGHFELRPAQRQLLNSGEPVALGARAFDVLTALVQNRERVVTKEELLRQVWQGVVVEENNLTVHVSRLRKLLGAGAVSTINGTGYQFTLPVSHAQRAASPAPACTCRWGLPCWMTSPPSRWRWQWPATCCSCL